MSQVARVARLVNRSISEGGCEALLKIVEAVPHTFQLDQIITPVYDGARSIASTNVIQWNLRRRSTFTPPWQARLA
jgi:hypothetical protein